MIKADVDKHILHFKFDAGTSRGVLKTKNSWIISIYKESNPLIKGIGEASIIEGLSPEWNAEYESRLNQFVNNANDIAQNNLKELDDYPSIKFAIESALLDLKNGGKQIYFDSSFVHGKKSIPINGLIWMGDKDFMQKQIDEKLNQGYSCIKLKIGAIDFNTELDLLKKIRERYSANTIELRVDANGAFTPYEALNKLERLSQFQLHSIEQPIKQNQWEEIQRLCAQTPLPIALDEELIGINQYETKKDLLQFISPQFIILKPSLLGGFTSSDEWIHLAEKNKIDWWITSALESNVGLNAIAQYTATKNVSIPQGLGTGQLFENNTESNLSISKGQLFYSR